MSELIQKPTRAEEDSEAEEWQKIVEAVCKKYRTPARDRIFFNSNDDLFTDDCEGE